LPRRIDRLLIDEQSVHYAAHFDELLLVTTITCKPRNLSCRHRTNFTETNLGNHTLKPRPRGSSISRKAKILIDDLDLRPAECGQPLAHRVLQGLAFSIVENLLDRRLPDVKQALCKRCCAPIFSMIIGAAPRIVHLAAGVLEKQASHQVGQCALDLVR
jgi:hypothetical protein